GDHTGVGFVQVEDLGPGQERQPQVQTSLLPTGQLTYRNPDLVDQADQLQGLTLVPGCGGQVVGQIHRLLDAEILHEAASLQDRVDALTYPARVVVGVLAEDTHTAGAGPTKTLQRIDGRGFTGTVRPEESKQFTRVDLEGDPFDRFEITVLLAQVADDHHRFGDGLPGGLLGWCSIRRHVSRL